MLIVMGGLPGTGKSTLAKGLARTLLAVHIRIDTIEQSLRDFGLSTVTSEGYELGYRLARDNLILGNTVIADSVNPIEITRQAWRQVAQKHSIPVIQIETICSNAEEHQNRVETRTSQIEGLVLPTWGQVQAREYEPWHTAQIIIDTANETPEESLQRTLTKLKEHQLSDQ